MKRTLLILLAMLTLTPAALRAQMLDISRELGIIK